ncbi:uncharacterized protein LOC141904754 [Tubulanus polymorphus]|uniref:uncharacterized protein LOC141904754 n=1 Tax=Tubulanus polymorphus TaxID=672921 RepID=UPI003DA6AB7D
MSCAWLQYDYMYCISWLINERYKMLKSIPLFVVLVCLILATCFAGGFGSKRERDWCPKPTCKRNRSRSFKPCRCDVACQIFGDCCNDYEMPMTSLSVNIRREMRRHLQCPLETKSVKVGKISMIRSCPKRFNSFAIKSLCEGNSVKDDAFMNWPVSSRVSGMVYRNLFCSMCWDEGGESISYWNLKLECPKQSESDCVRPKLNGATTVKPTFATITVKPEHEKLFAKNCGKKLLSPFKNGDNERDCYEKLDSKPCELGSQYENNCTRNPVDIVTSRKTKMWYKNKFCALCRGEQVSDLQCQYEDPPDHPSPGSEQSLTMLFDLELGTVKEDRKDSIKIQCKAGEIYDFVSQKCRSVWCGDGFEFIRGRCVVATDKNSNSSMNESCIIVQYSPDEYLLRSDGIIFAKALNRTFTSDLFKFGNNGSVNICVKHDEFSKYFRISSDLLSPDGTAGILSAIGQCISVICLAVLLIIYCYIPQLRNLPGKSLMSMSLALLLGQLMILLGPVAEGHYVACLLIAAFTHVFFLAMFFWMNAIAFDLTLTFTGRMMRSGQPNEQKWRFTKFCIYAWMSPLVILLISASLEISSTHTSPYNPDYGTRICWFNNGPALGVLFILPVSVLVAANMVMYTLTVYGICKASKAASIAKKSDKINILLYIKLSVILGGTWIFAFLWIVTRNVGLKYLFIVFNSLQGVFIFIAFICRRKVVRLLREQFTKSVSLRSKGSTTRSTRVPSSSSLKRDSSNLTAKPASDSSRRAIELSQKQSLINSENTTCSYDENNV